MAVEDPTCPIIKNLVLLDSEGKRIAVKYYSGEWPNISAQANFEKLLWSKTSRTNARQEAEIIMFDTFIVVYKYVGDLMFYATGSQDENELILYTVLQAFYESVSILLRQGFCISKGVLAVGWLGHNTFATILLLLCRQQVEKKTVLENLDLVLLCMDEIIDGGVILETEPQTIASRVTMRGAEGEGALPEQARQMVESHCTCPLAGRHMHGCEHEWHACVQDSITSCSQWLLLPTYPFTCLVCVAGSSAVVLKSIGISKGAPHTQLAQMSSKPIHTRHTAMASLKAMLAGLVAGRSLV
ncbi:hypothetical protein QJQ45_021704 [Haematococcus lacustris]|nr:hypothetical protein QJQ45_021704 [Haematococcus lacustris]